MKPEEDTYIECPKGFHPDKGEDYVLFLNKSLYGLRQAPLRFFEYLSQNLRDRGFVASPLEPCLFIHKDMICLVYVDDCLFFAKDGSKIDAMIADLQKTFEMTIEGDVSAFLGIQFKRDENNASITLTQYGLIDKVISLINVTTRHTPDKTPASPVPLGLDPEGEPFIGPWSYASAVGMLMYLASNSRPDIAFAVHQCARFTHNPKKSHGKAVERIVSYLQGTKRQGMIMKPSGHLTIDCYVDADFAGLYGVEDDQDPISVKSRTGYVLMLADCPLLWVSKLQSEISVSTMEAEYIALSTALRDLVPLREIIHEVAAALGLMEALSCCAHSTIFEDNNGALALATTPKLTPRSKHIGVKYHWFKQFVMKEHEDGQSGKRFIKIKKVASSEQKADIFTKGLPREAFVNNRNLLLGW
jgi:Reverse transcriptase (RNA-dependent DNA polymerase)